MSLSAVCSIHCRLVQVHYRYYIHTAVPHKPSCYTLQWDNTYLPQKFPLLMVRIKKPPPIYARWLKLTHDDAGGHGLRWTPVKHAGRVKLAWWLFLHITSCRPMMNATASTATSTLSLTTAATNTNTLSSDYHHIALRRYANYCDKYVCLSVCS